MSEAEDDVSHFAVDGVVAEMVIEVEDNQKSGSDDLANSPAKNLTNDKKADHDDFLKEAEKLNSEKSEHERKEDKENIEASEIKESKDNVKKGKNLGKEEENKIGQTFKRKRKSEFIESKDEITDMPRYSGRKRLANKRYLSEDMITSKSDKLKSQSKDTGVKRRKLEMDLKDTRKEMKIASNDKHPKKSLQNTKESNVKTNEEIDRDFKDEKSFFNIKDHLDQSKDEPENNIEKDMSSTKQNVLRKLPFRKNQNAPDVPDLEPKIFWWNGVGEGQGVKLGEIPEMRERIKGAKGLKSLYRVLFFQWPTNGQNLIGQILDFNGFPFDKSSYEFTKRQNLMKIMLDVTLSNMCELLGLKKGNKQTMINNILNYLLRPYKKVDPTLDPSLQPVVLLERIELGDKFFDQISEDLKRKRGASTTKSSEPLKKNKRKAVEILPTPLRTTRNSFRRVSPGSLPTKDSAAKPSDGSSDKLVVKKRGRPPSKPISKEKVSPVMKEGKTKAIPSSKDAKHSPKEKNKKTEEKLEISTKRTDENPKESRKLKGFKKKGKSFNNKKVTDKKSSDNDLKQKSIDETKTKDDKIENVTIDSDSDLAGDVDKKDEKKPRKQAQLAAKMKYKILIQESKKTPAVMPTANLSDSSETESAEETKLVTAAQKPAKVIQKRRGKPLGHFPKISECIQKANFSALQRLHILLFGASDKADNLKGNILAFGGFPFLEGSDEWKQKHFLLSLLAQNNLREYLNLLCIQYSDDDQPTMIDKLMKFLSAPSEFSEENKIQPIETEVVSSELTNKSPAPVPPPKKKPEVKKKVKKKEEKKKVGPRHRKVLMSEEEARRLEASFAREQRAIARDIRAPVRGNQIVVTTTPTVISQPRQQADILPRMKGPVADPKQLNALLQTVYKRRALKAAGAVVSTPNKGKRTKLGDIENIKFLIVTANLSDLEIVHHLIFMLDTSKSRLRKNILDFDGFRFNEDSEKYKERIEFLYSLGYDVSKRISFLLGLCSLQTDIPQQDLNELIMYFLMSPCKTKQVVPITEMPIVGTSEESFIMLKSTFDPEKSAQYQNALKTTKASSPKSPLSKSPASDKIQSSTPIPKALHQKARKSFTSIPKVSPVKRVLLPPSHTPVVSSGLTGPAIGNKSSITLLNSIHAVPAYSLAKMPTNVTVLNTPNNLALLNATKVSNANSFVRLPLNPGTKVQVMNQPPNVAVLDAAAKIPVSSVSNAAGQILQNQVVIPQLSNKIAIQPQQSVLRAPLLSGSMAMKNPSGFTTSSPQEFLIQQQTPDGQQKAFKLIRLPANHPLASVVGKTSVQQSVVSPKAQQNVISPKAQQSVISPKAQQSIIAPKVQQTAIAPQVQQQLILTSSPTTGFLLMKNSSGLSSAVQNLQSNLKSAPIKTASSVGSSEPSVSISKPDEFILPDEGESAQTLGSSSKHSDAGILNPLQEKPPTDEELFTSIQEIILSSNFEDITLRNVIERVSAQFPLHDLTHRHNYMKDCVKKIIIGTS